ncbi:MAG: butyrate kinase [Alistipes onderdonkii]
MGFKILAINPGSTSTKVALYDEERPSLDLTLRHTAEQIARYTNIIDQLGWRREMILTALSEHGFDIMQLSAVIGRGGLVRPIPAGVYEVNEAMRRDLTNATMEHASNLGGLLAAEIAAMAGVKAYIADPVVVDEMEDVARLSGHPDCPRKSIFHALNQKATARLHCDRIGIVYEKANLVVAHLGGGISVAAHKQGRVVDVNNALDGDGPFAPERAGSLPAGEFADLCFSGRYTRREVQKMLAGQGGLVAPGRQFHDAGLRRIAQGDEKARLVAQAVLRHLEADRRHGRRHVRAGRRRHPHRGHRPQQFVVRYIEQRCTSRPFRSTPARTNSNRWSPTHWSSSAAIVPKVYA